jgi:hypothetical protein
MMTEKQNPAIAAFIAAQANMGMAIKSTKNLFFKSTYADLTSIQESVYPAFHAQGFAIIQQSGADTFGRYVDTIAKHVSGEEFGTRVYLEFKAGDMQSLGSAITYARRYGLMSLTGIPTADDDGNAAAGRAAPPKDKAVKEMSKVEARDLADKMIGFFGTCTAALFAEGHERALDAIKDIAKVSIPISYEVETAMKAAIARLEA